MSSSDMNTITVIGSGLIGRSWAMVFVSGGYSVKIYDNQPGQAAKAIQEISHDDLSQALQGAFFVQECVFEQLDVKQSVFQDIERLVGEDIILSSSTSCLVPSNVFSKVQNRTRCIVSHPVNPPYYVKLVELVPHPETAAAVMDTTHSLMTKVGQAPIRLKREIDGFALNRVQAAIIAESWRLVQMTVLPLFDYGDTIYRSACKGALDHLDVLYHFVTNAPYRTHHWPAFESRAAEKASGCPPVITVEKRPHPPPRSAHITGPLLDGGPKQRRPCPSPLAHPALCLRIRALISSVVGQQDGVISVKDIDLLMSEGLGMRYAFIGPMETMHLNAPAGLEDYMKRYGEGITRVLNSFGPVPDFSGGEAAKKIVSEMCELVPNDPQHLSARIERRDQLLMALAKLKKDH
ncbi:hypothetical protein JOQ06_030411 [Pogonophryne albipinna]|uniref:Lambda-crystallin homolog n=1 Tax=Pogonophryne albipinna TaxID=1090488 RepID=A0AAD6FH12_9TELE|nr:hypothetical protein JOQ06_030411 [Pogonophryne albipinna]